MFGENSSQKELREKWPEMTKEEKWDTFLWKMSWFHSNIHVPGTPPHEAINRLSDKLEKASEKSDKLTASIRNATWVAAILGGLGVLVAVVKFIQDFQILR